MSCSYPIKYNYDLLESLLEFFKNAAIALLEHVDRQAGRQASTDRQTDDRQTDR